MEKFSNYVKKERKEKEEEIEKSSRVRVHKFEEITILQDVQETNVPSRLQKRRKEAMSWGWVAFEYGVWVSAVGEDVHSH